MRRSIASILVSLFVLTGAAALLSACNTMEGIGEDTSAAGRSLSNTATDVKEDM
jgi:entericidin B